MKAKCVSISSCKGDHRTWDETARVMVNISKRSKKMKNKQPIYRKIENFYRNYLLNFFGSPFTSLKK